MALRTTAAPRRAGDARWHEAEAAAVGAAPLEGGGKMDLIAYVYYICTYIYR